MPLKALVFYLQSKYKHEIIWETYIADTLHFSAFGSFEESKRPPRYLDVLRNKEKASKTTVKDDYEVEDIVDLFRGKGKLAKGGEKTKV